ncbi:hypothetical protein [Mycobacteroides chelonae]|uniref:hypothetical protein n=1 Tax=Mycobacteroides chelonae TaxID=1774 RepID=UPI000618BA7D|nr:hypothetical protein [Mycobacteroides chelonae]AKC37862.1 hypothetical protein GR01_03750 [Mycobacteroides chelonae]ANB00788.1 hypothetical protein BB28_03805 [Mycobacteroides chelonae CCUG 47445]OLT80941.1 hypothetical protein BKG56_01230 [Mycobacteroides chelonae]ORV16972.1 hypothetical protein AWB96_01515 [Mycobacteroides chelonae]
MSNPFGENLAAEPFETVFANLNPAIQGALDGFRELARMFEAGPQATAEAVATNLQCARGEGDVAVASLMAGLDAIFRGYRASFTPLGDSLNRQIKAISAAWETYGRSGRWIQPTSREVPRSGALEVLISTSDPSPMADGQHVTAETIESAIHKATTIARNLAGTSHHMFGGLVANALPVGELMDAIDIAAVDHAKAFADLHKSLAMNIQKFTNAIENSVNVYWQTDRWDAPTVATCT